MRKVANSLLFQAVKGLAEMPNRMHSLNGPSYLAVFGATILTGLLRGCRAKIERANECIINLNSEITAFLASDPAPYSVTREFRNDGRSYVFVGKSEKPVPDRFAVLAGEIVHHLASSLDHLFAALVIRNGNTVERKHSFPVFTSEKEFNKACGKGIIRDISVSAQRIVRSVQPYQNKTPTDTILFGVKELNNADKHRLLLVLAAVGAIGNKISIGADADASGKTIRIVSLGDPTPVEINENGAEFFRIDLAEPAPQFYANANIAVQIVFARCGAAKLIPLTNLLPGMVAGVTHTINLFRNEFDSDD
jgi:hypothetical protein